MSWKRSSRRSSTDRRRGFGVIEVLVSLGVVGLALGAAGQFLRKQSGDMRRNTLRVESQQALRGMLDAMTRDLRLAGACLPTNGRYVSLQGVDAPANDAITVRMGMVDDAMSCIDTTIDNGDADLNDPELAGATSIDVDDPAGFEVGRRVFIRHPNGSGDISTIASVGSTFIVIANGLSQAFPEGSGVYPMDERTYAIDWADPEVPVLTLQVNADPVRRFAAGIEGLQVQYVLDDDCPTCRIENLPTTSADWWLVNEIVITARARTVGAVMPDDEATVTMVARAKPRNLLP